jgi:hypothetical protein
LPALAYRNQRLQANGRGSAPLASEAQARLLRKVRGTAEAVFSKWAQAISASLERTAIDATRHVSESLVLATDTIFAAALEHFVRSLSATED